MRKDDIVELSLWGLYPSGDERTITELRPCYEIVLYSEDDNGDLNSVVIRSDETGKFYSLWGKSLETDREEK